MRFFENEFGSNGTSFEIDSLIWSFLSPDSLCFTLLTVRFKPNCVSHMFDSVHLLPPKTSSIPFSILHNLTSIVGSFSKNFSRLLSTFVEGKCPASASAFLSWYMIGTCCVHLPCLWCQWLLCEYCECVYFSGYILAWKQCLWTLWHVGAFWLVFLTVWRRCHSTSWNVSAVLISVHPTRRLVRHLSVLSINLAYGHGFPIRQCYNCL